MSGKGHPVLLCMANFATESECMRNDGYCISRITRKFTELGVLSCWG